MGAVVRGNHKSDCVPAMRPVPNGPPSTFVNWKQQMLLATDEIDFRDVSFSPREVWQIISRLYRTKRNHFGRESFGRIEIEPLCDVKHNPGLTFYQFHFTYYEDEVLHRVIGWSHPLLMDRLKQRHYSIFVDATFRCVPTQFYQLVVVMMYDPISDLYLPVWYVLTSGKTSQFYEHIFHYICVASKKRLDPADIVCDFEFAMIKAVKNQFPDSRIVGCLFHFKQALRRKMLEGIPDVRRMIKRDCRDQGILYSKESWKKFWKYFTNTWIKKFVPEWWNVNGLNEDIVTRPITLLKGNTAGFMSGSRRSRTEGLRAEKQLILRHNRDLLRETDTLTQL
ncbi:hypothetical protein PHPALM_30585 [Phytophthora palmivora]|uniref:MULE transposase domain-containing protein n=1 Tax=Phytophthora palmivora TaxID=4796 RepID=A0A2P4X4T0_9STRA|nr:hypothetical protein PHPALM_30585 [Phytophthora palmivora]